MNFVGALSNCLEPFSYLGRLCAVLDTMRDPIPIIYMLLLTYLILAVLMFMPENTTSRFWNL